MLGISEQVVDWTVPEEEGGGLAGGQVAEHPGGEQAAAEIILIVFFHFHFLSLENISLQRIMLQGSKPFCPTSDSSDVVVIVVVLFSLKVFDVTIKAVLKNSRHLNFASICLVPSVLANLKL